MENRGGSRVTLERLAGDFILRTVGSHGEILRRRGGGDTVRLVHSQSIMEDACCGGGEGGAGRDWRQGGQLRG